MPEFVDRDLYSGLIRLHVLHHASVGPIFGLGMLEELSRHGYRISPGTLYPILHGLEKKGQFEAAARFTYFSCDLLTSSGDASWQKLFP